MNIIEQQRSRARRLDGLARKLHWGPLPSLWWEWAPFIDCFFTMGHGIFTLSVPQENWPFSGLSQGEVERVLLLDHFQMYYLWVINRVEVPGYLRFCSTNRDGDKWPNIFFFCFIFFDSLHQTLKREKIQYKFCVCNVCLCNSKVVGFGGYFL